MNTTTQFRELPVGARFTYRGRLFVKLALSMAEDEQRNGTIFPDEMEVETQLDEAADSDAESQNPS